MPPSSLAAEVDGPHHLKPKQKAYDRMRDAVLRKKGIATMRFTADEVRNNRPAVVALIRDKIKRRRA